MKLEIINTEYKTRGSYNEDLKKYLSEITDSRGFGLGLFYSENELLTESTSNMANISADALNTHISSGKLPSELLRENQELIKAFKRLMPNMQGYAYELHKSNNWFEFAFKEEIELLKSLEQ